MKKVAVFLAEGFEEVEALTVVDLLRRVNIEVHMISITKQLEVTGGHGIKVHTNHTIKEMDSKKYDAYVLPGGMPGTTNLKNCAMLLEYIKWQNAEKKLVAAICAAPSILGELGLLKDKTVCCYPGYEKSLIGAKVTHNTVEVDENIITSRGLGTAIDFALSIMEILAGKEITEQCITNIIY